MTFLRTFSKVQRRLLAKNGRLHLVSSSSLDESPLDAMVSHLVAVFVVSSAARNHISSP